MGALWSAQAGYTYGLWLLLVLSALGAAALMLAQKIALRPKDPRDSAPAAA
jgi:hypothetical protein